MQKLLNSIKKAQTVALVSHVFPDGDAVSSLLSLYTALKLEGKTVFPVLKDGVPNAFQFLLKESVEVLNKLPNQDNTDLLIIVDCSDASRTGFTEEIRSFSKAHKLGVIDHHPKGDLTRLSTASYIHEEASSAAQLTYEVIRELGTKINPDLATCLLTGIYTDTGGFQHSNTSQLTLDIASELMRRGARLQQVVNQVSHHKSIAHLKLLGLALERAKLSLNGRCVFSTITLEDLASCKGTSEDINGIIGELNVLKDTDFTLLLTETSPGQVRGSLRTSDDSTFNVSTLAKALGGGGHPRAAGFAILGNLRNISKESYLIGTNLDL